MCWRRLRPSGQFAVLVSSRYWSVRGTGQLCWSVVLVSRPAILAQEGDAIAGAPRQTKPASEGTNPWSAYMPLAQ